MSRQPGNDGPEDPVAQAIGADAESLARVFVKAMLLDADPFDMGPATYDLVFLIKQSVTRDFPGPLTEDQVLELDLRGARAMTIAGCAAQIAVDAIRQLAETDLPYDLSKLDSPYDVMLLSTEPEDEL